MTIRFKHRGSRVFLEESHDLPLVDVVIKIAGGSLSDPEAMEGLTRVTGRLLRRGTKTMKAADVDGRVAALGARLSVSISRTSLGLHGSVLARNIEPFLALISELLHAPAFRNADLARAKRRIKASLVSLRDDDHGLASRHMRAHLFDTHPYGRSTGGTHATLGKIQRKHVAAQFEASWLTSNVSFGAAGAIDEATLRALLDRYFGNIPKGRASRPRLPVPKMARGRRLLVVDKPDRSQTQIGVGTLGIKARDPLYFPFLVADSAFGGMFTSRLMQAVRADRGWSYSAYSSAGASEQRDAWRMWTHPAVENARDCLALQLELLEAWVAKGPTGAEVRRAKKYLRGGRCFDEDTAYRRLDDTMGAALMRQGEEHTSGFRRSVSAVTRASAADSVRRRIRPRDLAIVVVGDASDIADSFGSLPGVTDVSVVPYDARL